VNALRVGMGDWKADPSLKIDKGCLTLGTVADILNDPDNQHALDPMRTALVQLQLGDETAEHPQLNPYCDVSVAKGKVRDIVLLLSAGQGRDFPRGFHEKLADSLGQRRPWMKFSMPRLSIHGAISLLGHYWDLRALPATLGLQLQKAAEQKATEAAAQREAKRALSETQGEKAESTKTPMLPPEKTPVSPADKKPGPEPGETSVSPKGETAVPRAEKTPGSQPGKTPLSPAGKTPGTPRRILLRSDAPPDAKLQEGQESKKIWGIVDPASPTDSWEDLVDD